MFFGYFLNTKKVTPSADFVISPAKAGAFLFFHTRLPLSPRPLLPFGRISPAAKPGWPVTGPTGAAILPFPSRLRRAGAPTAKTRRLLPFGRISLRETARPVIGPTFWVCRAKSGAAFRCAKPPCAVVRFAAMASPPRTGILPSPSRLCRAGSPTAKTRPLLPFGRISPAAKPGWPVVAPAGGNVLATPFSLCSNVAPRSHPGARRLTPPFRLRRNRACGHRPHLLGLPRKIRRGISLRETTLCGCPLRGHDFVTPHQCFGLPRFRSAQAWPLGQQPGACRHSAPFRCAKPRVRLPAPPFGFAAQNQARHFAARNHPVRLSASRP